MNKIVFIFTIVMFFSLEMIAQPSSVNRQTVWRPNTTVLKSPDSRYKLLYQRDGNLVLYKNGNKAIWHTRTDGKTPKKLVFQTDGNFVLYGYNPNVVWNSDSYNKGGKVLKLQNDGNLVIYTNRNKPIWSTNTWEKN